MRQIKVLSLCQGTVAAAVLLTASVTSAAGSAGGVVDSRLAGLVEEDVNRPVRPGVVPERPGGLAKRAFWNRRSIHFMHPPAFDFTAIEGVGTYRFSVYGADLEKHEFTASQPSADLSPVWRKLPTGFVRVEVAALDNNGRTVAACGERRFWKLAKYEPGAYPEKPYSYTDCIRRWYPTLFAHTNTQHFLKYGVPDGYSDILNIYPSKMNSALIRGMIRYSKMSGAPRDAALAIARKAADYLLSISQGKDAPLANFPPTYWKMKGQKSDFASQKYAGQNLLEHPALVGEAYLELSAAVGDKKYRDAAVAIAETYARLQLPDGTWYIKLWEKDGSPVLEGGGSAPVKITPTTICLFLENIANVTGETRWRAIADKAFAYIDAGPLKTYDFGPQFEDTKPSVNYRDLTSVVPMNLALYLLKRFPDDPRRVAQARELSRWVEDQFVCWRPPFQADGRGILSEPKHGFNPLWNPIIPMTWGFRRSENWIDVPGVMEKYRWSININSVVAMALRMYLELYRVTGDELALAKAKTLGDAIVRVQAMGPDGEIATHWDLRDVKKGVSCLQNWTNCGVISVVHLEELAKEVEKKN